MPEVSEAILAARAALRARMSGGAAVTHSKGRSRVAVAAPCANVVPSGTGVGSISKKMSAKELEKISSVTLTPKLGSGAPTVSFRNPKVYIAPGASGLVVSGHATKSVAANYNAEFQKQLEVMKALNPSANAQRAEELPATLNEDFEAVANRAADKDAVTTVD